MTIEIVTGGPGAGKTCYVVAKRLVNEVGRELAIDDESCVKLGLPLGTIVKRRVVQAGIRGLTIDHARIGHVLTEDGATARDIASWNQMVQERDDNGKPLKSTTPVNLRVPGSPPVDCAGHMHAQNWWLWAMPGDLIVIDEAHYLMPRGSINETPPYWIHAMAVHRHYGVDFILVTQHPNSIDSFAKGLCTVYRHVRSVMGSPVCMLYQWDHATNPERISLAYKSWYWRKASFFKLYKSTVAVVKPPTVGRGGLGFVVAGALAVIVGFKLFFDHKFGEKPAPVSAASASPAVSSFASPSTVAGPSGYIRPRVGVLPGYPELPKVTGCYAVRDLCRCIDEHGGPVPVRMDLCRTSSTGFAGLVQWEPRRSLLPPSPGASAPSVLPPALKVSPPTPASI